jgi:hypothetical protein
MNYDNILCHIIGLNSITKKKFINKINPEYYELIDLDNINKNILTNPDMDNMFKQYKKFKDSKNDKYKDVEKKMTLFWENNFNNLLLNQIPQKKKSILIGSNSHYRNMSKKIDMPTNNKFMVNTKDEDIKSLIEYNLNTYRTQIINGTFSLNYLDESYLKNQKEKLIKSYEKNGYLLKTIDQINSILKLLEKKDIKGKGLYIALKEPYNLNTKIHPKKNSKVFAYLEPIHALITSFNWKENELEEQYNGKDIKLILKNKESYSKFKDKRYLYLVDKSSFIPHEKASNKKFFSQVPVNILEKEDIENVYSKLKYLGILIN